MLSCKFELKFTWTKHCVLAATAVRNDNAQFNYIIFTIKNTKMYVPVFTLLVKDNLSKGFEKSMYWNKYKTKRENKSTENEYRYFLE